MGQILKTDCGCTCFGKEREEINIMSHHINNSSLSSIPPFINSNLIPKLISKENKHNSYGDLEVPEDKSFIFEKKHVYLNSAISSGSVLHQNDTIIQKTNNTSYLNSTKSLPRVQTQKQTKAIPTKLKKFIDYSKIEESCVVNNIYHPTSIQALFRGRIFRKKFNGKKITLKLQSEAVVNSLISEYDKKEFKYVEGYAPLHFDYDGYLKYEDTKNHIPFDSFGYIVKNKAVVCNYNGVKSLYLGSMNLANERHGKGILFTSKGEKYEGTWINNKMNGWGRLIAIEEEKSLTECIFDNGKPNGYGWKYWSDKRYEGEFNDGIMKGKGKELSNMYKYEGNYDNDNKNGFGKIVYLDTHDAYEGDFKDNMLTGFGFYTWENKHTYKGDFLNGNMHGKGKYEWPEGGYYEGEYINNIKQGFGEFKWPDGKIYKGTFKDWQPDGKGIIFSKNKETQVEFKAGKIIKSKKK